MRGAGALWTMPLLLGVLTLVGLTCALLGDGVWDALSAVSLGLVVLAGAWYGLRRPPRRRPHQAPR